MVHRKTQTADYWQKQFAVSDQDLDAIYHQILEHNRPIDLDDLAKGLVIRHCNVEEVAARKELQEGSLYQPKESYAVDDRLVFSALDFAVGTVISSRKGQHPDYGNFEVIEVDFEEDSYRREFAAVFEHDHPLNIGDDQSLANLQGLLSPEELYQTYHDSIRSKVKATLDKNDDFVQFHEQYFLRDLLPEFHEGLFNIADAAIDINNGPLSVDALIEQMGMLEAGQDITDVMRFSVSYQLANDERFDDVGPRGETLWYLDRLKPPEAHHPPRRLQAEPQKYNSTLFDDDLRILLSEIDDELTHRADVVPVGEDIDQITVVLNYPHRRIGSLPLTPKTETFFPSSDYNSVLFEFIDGQTGNSFPGWTVLNHSYVFGLKQWYQKNNIPVGAYLIIKRTKNPLQLIIDYQTTRTQRDWVRMAVVQNNRLGFQMNPTALSCKYDELMIVVESDTAKLDGLWLNMEERGTSIYNILTHIFPELAKLNPQSTVHSKTLYSAVNVVRRAAPGTVFHELITHRCFVPMNHGYWTYDPSLRD